MRRGGAPQLADAGLRIQIAVGGNRIGIRTRPTKITAVRTIPALASACEAHRDDSARSARRRGWRRRRWPSGSRRRSGARVRPRCRRLDGRPNAAQVTPSTPVRRASPRRHVRRQVDTRVISRLCPTPGTVSSVPSDAAAAAKAARPGRSPSPHRADAGGAAVRPPPSTAMDRRSAAARHRGRRYQRPPFARRSPPAASARY